MKGDSHSKSIVFRLIFEFILGVKQGNSTTAEASKPCQKIKKP